MFLTTFRRFPSNLGRVPKIFQNCSESLTNVSEHFSNIFRRLPTISEGTEDFRGGTDDASIIQHHLWVLSERLCSYSNGNLKTCDDNLIFSPVKISCLRAKAHLVFHWCLYNKYTHYFSVKLLDVVVSYTLIVLITRWQALSFWSN